MIKYELEQRIMACWGIIDDLRDESSNRHVIADYYEHKFNLLWKTFEELCSENRNSE